MSDLINLAKFALGVHRRKRGIAGQCFTEWTCLLCPKEDMHANTAVPLLCKECESRLAALVKGNEDGS